MGTASSRDGLIVFAGGGTGGHLFPALSVAGQLRELAPAVRVRFWGTVRPIDRDVVGTAGYELVAQNVNSFPSRPWHWPGFLMRWRESVGRCVEAFEQDRPTVVIGAGGYAAGPPVRAANKLGIPVTLLNPDAIPGRANRHLMARAKHVFVQWEVSRPCFNGSVRVHVTGCPVREKFFHPRREAGLTRFGLDPNKKTLLVTGASQGARTINEAILGVWPRLAGGDWQVLHLTGSLDFDRVRNAMGSSDPTARIVSFTDDMDLALACADLVLSRAGASTLAELTAVGRPSVLMPYPYHRDQHQMANARVLADAGAAEIVRDQKDAKRNVAALESCLAPLLEDENRLARMSAAAKSLGRPDAARAVAELLLAND